MMKKVLALALCVCMAAMLLAGCGGAGRRRFRFRQRRCGHQRLRRGRAGSKHQSDAHLCHLRQRGHGPV